jgi:hypothetical protein
MITDISLRGFVVGPIWWPAGAECFKDLAYSITREDGRLTEPGTLRDHVLRATNDGDFQHCTIALGEIVVTCVRGRRKVQRSFPLRKFPSIADCLHPEGDDWCPSFPDDDAF